MADQATVKKVFNPPGFQSHYIDVENMPWEKLGPGSERKVLFHDPATGMQTWLCRLAPGGVIPFHEHPGIEQTFVLEGAFADDEGECTAGNFVIRAKGSRHSPVAPNGCTMLVFFMKPTAGLKKALQKSGAATKAS